MNSETFKLIVKGIIPVGTVLQNPGGGTSIIKSLTDSNISYRRGKTTISVKFEALFNAYEEFKGKQVSSRNLKDYAPSVFNTKARPAGHDCNCTFLFMVLCRLPLVNGIEGRGIKGSPFSVYIPK